MLTGEEFDYHCHSNLTRAVLPFGLAESDVHDVLNVFQVTGLDREGRYFMYVNISFSRCSLIIHTFIFLSLCRNWVFLFLHHHAGSSPTPSMILLYAFSSKE